MTVAIAFHEAAHAVVAVALGASVTSATLVPPVVRIEWSDAYLSRLADVRRWQAIVGIAGTVAECRITGEPWHEQMPTGAQDFTAAWELVGRSQSKFEQAKHDAETLVDKLWPEITTMALTLHGGKL